MKEMSSPFKRELMPGVIAFSDAQEADHKHISTIPSAEVETRVQPAEDNIRNQLEGRRFPEPDFIVQVTPCPVRVPETTEQRKRRFLDVLEAMAWSLADCGPPSSLLRMWWGW